MFCKIYLEVEENVRHINYGDECLEVAIDDSQSDCLKNQKEAISRFWLNLRIKENMLAQKSKVKWLNDSDCNSSFFDKVMKERRRYNHIGMISSSGALIELVVDNKEEVWSHFSNKFVESEGEKMVLEGITFNSISMKERLVLENMFQEE